MRRFSFEVIFPSTKMVKMLLNRKRAKTTVLVASVFLAGFFISSFFKTHGTSTFILDVRHNKNLTLSSYLSSHIWRNVSSEVDIRMKLYLKRDVRNTKTTRLKYCPGTPVNLEGRVPIQPFIHDFNNLEHIYPEMRGKWQPETCSSREKVAVILHHRQRENHLAVLILNILPVLQRQQIDFTIFVVNQTPLSKYNRGVLLNVGFLEASKIHRYDCFIFHDVDMLPLDDRNLYMCGHYPRYMSPAVDKFKFEQIEPEAFGGVVSFTREQFLRINEASNLYFGWGGEDNDLWRRIHGSNMFVVTHPYAVSRYSMIKHKRDVGNEKNPIRFDLLETAVKRMYEDGLNTVQYKRVGLQLTKLFVWMDIQVDEDSILKNAPEYTKATQEP